MLKLNGSIVAACAHSLTAGLAFSVLAQTEACSSNFDNALFSGASSSAGGAGGAGGYVTDATNVTGMGGSATSSFIPTTTAGGRSGSGGFEECEAIENEVTLLPISMFLQVDLSLSMLNDNKWPKTKDAFVAFFNEPSAQKSLNVALRFWPDDGCDSTCKVDPCSEPAVPLGPLSKKEHVDALTSSMTSKMPYGVTPMSAALAGATKWAVSRQNQVGGAEKVIVVFLTDGEPTTCDTNISNIAKIADDAFKEAEILTFAVGLDGSNVDQMNKIAQGGHTDKAFLIGKGDVQAELLASLKKIQESVLACDYLMPTSADPNSPIDPTLVNVAFTPGDGDPKVTFTQVADETKCGASESSWYYDDPVAPKALLLCPKTCEKVQQDSAAALKIALGCATKVQ